MSNLPIENTDDVEKIIDYYRQRWKIEEFFKALKTGCNYRIRQQHSYQGLVNVISMMMPIAWKILCLKELSFINPEAPATTLFSGEECEVLRFFGPEKMPENPTVQEFFFCLARYGGFIKQKGRHPGWQILCRSLLSLEEKVIGWKAAKQLFLKGGKLC